MIKTVEIAVAPAHIQDEAYILNKAIKKARCGKPTDWRIAKKSIDARKSPIFRLRIDLFLNEEIPTKPTFISQLNSVQSRPKVIVVGAGPAGYFAAIQLIKLGLRPIVLERGKDVQARRRDLKAIQQNDTVNPHSNYCFGEGGAGTYSDGKLYTRSHKRGNIQEILEILVEHGAKTDILVDAHPHIGSNKLPGIIAKMRETIESNGGEIKFDTYVTDFILHDRKLLGVIDENGNEHLADATILATGHSARDIFRLLEKHSIRIEPKPFALGVRIEHPQSAIDKIQYDQEKREENLPASSYRVVTQVDEVGVFSFCMCPGGLIVPAATAPGEVIVNGMSLSKRDSPYANSGFVTSVENSLVESMGYTGHLANLEFQEDVEHHLFSYGDGSQKAPAMRMTDFTRGVMSKDLNPCSYIPGLYSAPLHELLPEEIYHKLARGMEAIGKKMKGFCTSEANVVGIESRTSSPVRIPRDPKTLMHEVKGLFPCGEGAGFAGGILSAAIDGRRVAEAIGKYLDR